MIELTRANDLGLYTNSRGLKFFLCDDGIFSVFKYLPNVIKAYAKNPKKKGARKAELIHNDRYVKVKNEQFFLVPSVRRLIEQELKTKTFWVVAK